MDVALRARTMVVPGLAAVFAHHEAAELNADEQAAGVVRAGRDPADVRRPRTRRKAPGRRRGDRAEALELLPRRTAVAAPKEHARLAAGVERPIGADRDGEDVALRKLGCRPRLSGVVTPRDAPALRAGEHRRPRGRDALDARERRDARLPPVAALAQDRDAVARCRNQPAHGNEHTAARGANSRRWRGPAAARGPVRAGGAPAAR